MLIPLQKSPISKVAATIAETGATKAPPKRRDKVLIDDTEAVTRKMQELFQKYKGKWKCIYTEADLIDYISRNAELGFDTETTGLFCQLDEIVGFSLGTAHDCVYIPLNHITGKNYTGNPRHLERILQPTRLYGFNFIFDAMFMKKRLGVKVKCVWDGLLAQRVYNSSALWGNGLKEQYHKFIDSSEPIYSASELFGMSFACYDPEVVGVYAAVDAMKHYILGKWQEANPTYPAALQIMHEVEIPLTHLLVDVCLTGVAVHFENAGKLQTSLERDLKALEEEFARDWGGVNPNSSKQLGDLLFNKLGIKRINGDSTAENVLQQIDHPIVEKVIAYREIKKGLSTYAAKLPEWARQTGGRLYCDFNQMGAETGRMSSSNPNMQNIPKDNRYRNMFKASEGCTLVSCDYSQQEIYILAALCQDPRFVAACNKGLDFYQLLASEVYNLPYEDCGKKGAHGHLRNEMKSVALGLNYDMSVYSLAATIHKSVEEAQSIYNRIYDRFPGIKTFREKTHEFAYKNGYVETMIGRRRFFNELSMPNYECDNKEVLEVANSLRSRAAIQALIADCKKENIILKDNTKQKHAVVRQFVNTRVQGSAADETKLAMLAIANDAQLTAWGCKIILQVHDEIIAEFPDAHAREGGLRMAAIMVQVAERLTGIKAKCEPSWMKVWEKD